ncbi:MAG: hypothetical protein RIS17_349, partial [Pseudomonadota bacterium]
AAAMGLALLTDQPPALPPFDSLVTNIVTTPAPVATSAQSADTQSPLQPDPADAPQTPALAAPAIPVAMPLVLPPPAATEPAAPPPTRDEPPPVCARALAGPAPQPAPLPVPLPARRQDVPASAEPDPPPGRGTGMVATAGPPAAVVAASILPAVPLAPAVLTAISTPVEPEPEPEPAAAADQPVTAEAAAAPMPEHQPVRERPSAPFGVDADPPARPVGPEPARHHDISARIGEQRAARHLAAALQDGRQVSVRIAPATLGQIDLTVGFAGDGRLSAVVAAPPGPALELIRRETGAMVQALAEQGIRADSQSFRFETTVLPTVTAGSGTGQNTGHQNGADTPAWGGATGFAGHFQNGGQSRQTPFRPTGDGDTGGNGGGNDGVPAPAAATAPSRRRLDMMA